MSLYRTNLWLTVLASSRQREFHPKPLTEPYLTISRHTALLIQIYKIKLNNLLANDKINKEIAFLFAQTICMLWLNLFYIFYTVFLPT